MSQKKKIHQISLNPSSITCALGGIAFALIAISVVSRLLYYSFSAPPPYIYRLNYYFYLGNEHNLPTYFSSFLLLFSALLLRIITKLEKNQNGPYVSKWAFLSICFVFLALDEALSLHERLTSLIHILWDKEEYGILYYSWIIPYMVFILFLSIIYLRFFLELNAKTRFNFLIAMILYIGGAIGCELFEGYYYELHKIDLTYSMAVNIEESMEIAGVIIFIRGLLVNISDNFKEVTFRFDYHNDQTISADTKT